MMRTSILLLLLAVVMVMFSPIVLVDAFVLETTSSSSSSSKSRLYAEETSSPSRLSRLASDLVRRVRWGGNRMTPATSAALYLNPATAKIASGLTVSWEPAAAAAIAQAASAAAKRAASTGQTRTPFLVGVVGIPGSGKSTSCDILAAHMPRGGKRTLVMPADGYHLSLADLAQLPDPADAIYRRGAPDTFAPAALLADLERIKYGREATVSVPGFDHAMGDPTEGQHVYKRAAHDVVIVEGIYLLHTADGWETVRDLLDYTVYIQADVDACIDRLKIRNQCIPGYTAAEIEVRCEAVDRVNANTVVRGAEGTATLTVQSAAMNVSNNKNQKGQDKVADAECDLANTQVAVDGGSSNNGNNNNNNNNNVMMPSNMTATPAEMEQYVETVEKQAEAILSNTVLQE